MTSRCDGHLKTKHNKDAGQARIVEMKKLFREDILSLGAFGAIPNH